MNKLSIDWTSSETHFLCNPRMPALEVRDVEQRLKTLCPLDAHLWLATSGSTAQVAGQLKWIALSKAAVLASAQAVNEHLKATANDVWVTVLPTFHVGGIGIYARAHLSGARVVDGLRWDPKYFHQVCTETGGTLSALVPTQVYDLVQARLQAPASLRAIVIGGAALSEPLYLEALKLGWPLLPSYGMTECCSQIATASLASLSVKPSRFPELQLLSHVEASQSSDGKLRVKSLSLLTGLAVLASSGDQYFDPKIDGWFQSEDMGDISESALGRFLRVRGRSSDFVKIGGESVDLNRLTSIFTEVRAEIGASTDLIIFPMPDERLENVIHGVAAVEKGSTQAAEAEKIFAAFNSRVFPFERTRALHFVERIPRSPLQKLLKSELLALLSKQL